LLILSREGKNHPYRNSLSLGHGRQDANGGQDPSRLIGVVMVGVFGNVTLEEILGLSVILGLVIGFPEFEIQVGTAVFASIGLKTPVDGLRRRGKLHPLFQFWLHLALGNGIIAVAGDNLVVWNGFVDVV